MKELSVVPVLFPIALYYNHAASKPEWAEDEKKEFLQFYISLIAFYHLSGDRPEYPRESVAQVLDKFEEYRGVANRDGEFREYAREEGFETELSAEWQSTFILSLENIGLICSPRARDRKFVAKTLIDQFRTLDTGKISVIDDHGNLPDISKKKMPPIEEIRKFQPKYSSGSLAMLGILEDRLQNPLSKEAMTGDTVTLSDALEAKNRAFQDATRELTDVLKKARTNNTEIRKSAAAFFIALFGFDAWDHAESLFETTLTKDEFFDCVDGFDIHSGQILCCTEEVWARGMLATFKLAYHTDENSDFDDDFTEFFDWELAPIFRGLLEANADCEELREKVQRMEEQLTLNPQQQSASLDTECNAKKEEIAKLKEEVESLNKKLAAQINCTKEKQSALKQAKNDLAEKRKQLSLAKQENLRLNQMLLNAGEDFGVFFEEELKETDEAEANGDWKERLGKDKREYLAQKKVLILGGHSNAHTVILQMFPHWQVTGTDSNKDLYQGGTSSYDAIVVITSYCSHQLYYKGVKMAKDAKIPMFACPKTSPTTICERIYNCFQIHS